MNSFFDSRIGPKMKCNNKLFVILKGPVHRSGARARGGNERADEAREASGAARDLQGAERRGDEREGEGDRPRS